MNNHTNSEAYKVKKLLFRFFAFWPYFLLSLIISVGCAYLYLRYTDYFYRTSTVIEIIDKAQDSEMALPTSMTIFNRSMINLDNEFGRINSYNLNSNVVKKTKANIKFYNVGKIKSTQLHYSEFFDDFEFTPLIEVDKIREFKKYKLLIKDDKLKILCFDAFENEISRNQFNNLSTLNQNHNLPFELKIQKINKDYDSSMEIERLITISPFRNVVEEFMSYLNAYQYSTSNSTSFGGSDQIKIDMEFNNYKISEDYLSELIYAFDNDGISERQLEYKRTIDFAETRAIFLQKEVELIETRKQKFKQENKLTDLKSDANLTIAQQSEYDGELFQIESQLDLLQLLNSELDENKFDLLPSNFGLKNENLNSLILQYNTLVKERLSLISYGAGSNNFNIKSVENQLTSFYENIINSLEAFDKSLQANIKSINQKEKQFEDFYSEIPEKERILREIERELIVKESLYSLLLQKKEEAAINFAVVKPTIKVIDSPRSSRKPVEPNSLLILFVFIALGLFFPLIVLSVIFYFDNKIHLKDDLDELGVPVLGEIPYFDDGSDIKLNNINSSDRSPLIESIRMLIANMNFLNVNTENKNGIGKSILISSSIKGEGKTLISTHFAKVLSFNNKVILIGADLRNPQIHKLTDYDKSLKGLSDFIYLENLKWQDLIINTEDLDILFSGTIPPNPTEMLDSAKFKNLISELKNLYDYVIIDSAPCLLVADTLKFSKEVDQSLLITRANFTDVQILNFIKSLKNEKKLSNMGIVLNCVGSSASYGYKYIYNYQYRYGYQYNYGYGYGYKSDD